MLIVVSVQEDSFGPHLVGLTCADQLGNEKLSDVNAEVVHQLVRLVLGVNACKLGVNTIMAPLKGLTLLQQLAKFGNVTEFLVEVNDILKMVLVNDDILATKSCHAEFFSTNTCEANLLPHFGNANFLGRFESSLVLLETNVSDSQFLVVGGAFEKQFSSEVCLIIKAAFTTLQQVCLIGLSNHSFEVGKEFFTALRVSNDQLRVDLVVLKGFASHDQKLDQHVIFVVGLSEQDDTLVHLRVVSFNESLNCGLKLSLIKLSLAEFSEDAGNVLFLSEFGSLPHIVHVVQEYFNSLNRLVELLVNSKGLLKEFMLGLASDASQLESVIVVETVDVFHHLAGLRSDSSQNEQVLQVFVVSEV